MTDPSRVVHATAATVHLMDACLISYVLEDFELVVGDRGWTRSLAAPGSLRRGHR
ncbi:hypothetical protein [Streptomyces sp. ME19-01-6]|uniref:hypothetical protein n=1 Tax=Streptomyces sp. ME19-01-6 TaxID=3028686 RepID=UPI0029B677E4|nr:hypothetical protein [Streptomyces sp. ME19-01-6]MDX3230454.1 hypothetical protein [Streptomyces sp. ME19-01-6]